VTETGAARNPPLRKSAAIGGFERIHADFAQCQKNLAMWKNWRNHLWARVLTEMKIL
jgi:hypothetical protein